MNYNDNQLDEILASLPEELQDFIVSPEVSDALEHITSSQKIFQKDILRQKVYLTLLGLQSTNDLEKDLSDSMKLGAEKATKILFDLDEAIFDRARQIIDGDSKEKEGAVLTQRALLNEIENPHPSEMKTVSIPQPTTATSPATPTGVATPKASQPQAPQNLPTMPAHHELMKYYAGTEPIMPEQIDYSGPVPLKKKDQPKLTDTPRYDKPRYAAGSDPYREPSK